MVHTKTLYSYDCFYMTRPNSFWSRGDGGFVNVSEFFGSLLFQSIKSLTKDTARHLARQPMLLRQQNRRPLLRLEQSQSRESHFLPLEMREEGTFQLPKRSLHGITGARGDVIAKRITRARIFNKGLHKLL